MLLVCPLVSLKNWVRQGVRGFDERLRKLVPETEKMRVHIIER